MFDATDLEIARREHEYEMGGESRSERAWTAFYNRARIEIVSRAWDGRFDNGTSRGLDGCDWEDGYSIDGAYEAFENGWSVDRYITAVGKARTELGL